MWTERYYASLPIEAGSEEEARGKARAIWREQTPDFLGNANFATSRLIGFEVERSVSRGRDTQGGLTMWRIIMQLKGRTLKTLAQGKVFLVTRVDDGAVTVVPEGSGFPRTIPRAVIEESWEDLTKHGSLARGDVGGWSSAYVVALLAEVPGTVVERSPIQLRLR